MPGIFDPCEPRNQGGCDFKVWLQNFAKLLLHGVGHKVPVISEQQREAESPLCKSWWTKDKRLYSDKVIQRIQSSRSSLEKLCRRGAELCRGIRRPLTKLLYRDVRNRSVTAEFEPKDSIFWDPQEENWVAKGKVRKYYTLRSVRRNWLGAEKDKRQISGKKVHIVVKMRLPR